MQDWPLRFGVFLPPMHLVGTNPTLNLQRDLELAEHLDRLGYDEIWCGEHHSAGSETIASPEVFLAAASQRTKRIRLGTGVNSLPYHHPLILADRLVLLDHLLEGRFMCGVGPGQLTSDALMLGIDTTKQRPMMEEAFEVMMRLFRGETVTHDAGWFTCRDAVLQLRPYSHPLFDIVVASSISPSGPKLAGTYGAGMLSLAATTPAGFEVLDSHWQVAEETAHSNGKTVDRTKWRMMGPMYVAETLEQAIEETRYGLKWVMDYISHVVPTEHDESMTHEEIVEAMNTSGGGVVGTPEMAIAQIQRLIDHSGGFGAYLFLGADFAPWPQQKRSYELFAERVIPHFKQQLAAPKASYDLLMAGGDRYVQLTVDAQALSKQSYDAARRHRRRVTEDPIWTPGPDRIRASRVEEFRAFLAARFDVVVDDSRALHDFSCRQDGVFWRALWEFARVPGDPGDADVAGESFDTTAFFPDGRVDVAAAMLAGAPDDTVVIGCTEAGTGDRLSRAELRRQVAAMAASLRGAGVEPGDVVAAYATTSAPTLVTMLGAAACGAVFTSVSVEFGVEAVVDRLSQTSPSVLLAIDRYTYAGRDFDVREQVSEIARRLRSLHTVIIGSGPSPSPSSRPSDLDLDPRLTVLDYDGVVAATHRLQTVERGFNAPGSVLFSSGTTGRPKCIVHRAGGVLLKHLSEMLLHCDIRPNDRLLYYTTPSWMMWNWLVSGLAAGACIVLYSGSPAAPNALQLLEMAEREDVTYFGTSPGYIDTIRRKVGGESTVIRQRFDLSKLRTIGSTGAPLSPTTARFAASWASDVQVLSKSGGTDLCGGLVTGDPTRPVWAGEIQSPAVGCAIAIVDEHGNDVPPGVRGELVSRTAFPSMPLGFLGDDSRSVLRRTYFEKFPGCWHQSDFARQTDHGGYIIEGRSDTTLNVHGVRIGTAEIYSQLDRFPWVQAAAAVEQRREETSRLVLLLELAPHETLTEQRREDIAVALRENCSPRHVPAVIQSVAALPRTMNSKVSEVAASDAINGLDVRGRETLANPHVLAALGERVSADSGEV